MSVDTPNKADLSSQISKIVDSRKGKTNVSGYWLNVFLRSIINYFSNRETPIWMANISQSGVDSPPALTIPGKLVQNTIEYEGKLVNITFEYISIGVYKCVADQPIFDRRENFGLTWANNYIVDGGGLVTEYGEIIVTHNPALPYEFIFKTFDGLAGGAYKNGLLDNCILGVFRIC